LYTLMQLAGVIELCTGVPEGALFTSARAQKRI